MANHDGKLILPQQIHIIMEEVSNRFLFQRPVILVFEEDGFPEMRLTKSNVDKETTRLQTPGDRSVNRLQGQEKEGNVPSDVRQFLIAPLRDIGRKHPDFSLLTLRKNEHDKRLRGRHGTRTITASMVPLSIITSNEASG